MDLKKKIIKKKYERTGPVIFWIEKKNRYKSLKKKIILWQPFSEMIYYFYGFYLVYACYYKFHIGRRWEIPTPGKDKSN